MNCCCSQCNNNNSSVTYDDEVYLFHNSRSNGESTSKWMRDLHGTLPWYEENNGGGHRCVFIDKETSLKCDKGAQGSTKLCINHGGGHRCNMADCDLISLLSSKK